MQINSTPPISAVERQPAQNTPAQGHAQNAQPPPPKPIVPAPPIRPTIQDSIDIVRSLMLLRQV